MGTEGPITSKGRPGREAVTQAQEPFGLAQCRLSATLGSAGHAASRDLRPISLPGQFDRVIFSAGAANT
jgi:hypothetical protein